jgi:hypothetical protein
MIVGMIVVSIVTFSAHGLGSPSSFVLCHASPMVQAHRGRTENRNESSALILGPSSYVPPVCVFEGVAVASELGRCGCVR